MKCPECKKSESKVMESRELYDGELIRRRRECLKCQTRFTTYERIEQPVIMVIKRDGKREQFSRSKIANGVYRACEKREIPELEIEEVVGSIEKKIRARGENEIFGEYLINAQGEDVGSKFLRNCQAWMMLVISVLRLFTNLLPI